MCAFSPAGFWTPGGPDETRATRTIRRLGRLSRATQPLAPVAFRSAALRRIGMRDIATHGERLTPGQAVQSLRDLIRCDVADDLLGTSESVAPLDPLPCPITLAWAEHYRIFPVRMNGATAQKRLPHADFVILPGVGHCPMIDDPALCAQTILESAAAT